MISKRSRRNTGPQENLKQFSLNNSKGVDETKPIIDPNTVSYMKNLTVNLDGSLSLRKPMKAHKTKGLTTDNIFLMFTEKHYLVFSGESGGVGFSIVDENGNPCNLVYEVQDYYTNELTTFTNTKGKNLFDTSAASCINTAGSTVIGNSYIYAQTFSDTGASSVVGKAGFTVVDASLYDTFNENSKLPRYIQITQSEDSEDTFKVAVKTPEINTLTTAEGEPSLNPNMTLDNPYAIRDVYNSTYLQILGIIPYVRDIGDSPYSLTDSNIQVMKTQYSVEDVSNIQIVSKEKSERYFKYVNLKSSALLLKAYSDDSYVYVNTEVLGTFNITQDDKVSLTLGAIKNGILKKLSDINTAFTDTYTFSIADVASQSGTVSKINLRYGGEDPYEITVSQALDLLDVENLVVYSLDAFVVSIRAVAHSTSSHFTHTYDIRHLTESFTTREARTFKPVSSFNDDVSLLVLKAFCKFTSSKSFYCSWEYLDGNVWKSIYIPVPSRSVYLLVYDDSTTSSGKSILHLYNMLELNLSNLNAYNRHVYRPDVLPGTLLKASNLSAYSSFRFKIFEINIDKHIDSLTILGSLGNTFSMYEFNLSGNRTEYLETDLPNAVLGDKYYYKKSIYSYGVDEYNGVVHVSNPGSFITPLYNVLEIGASARAVPNSIVPWRDYIITFTENDVSLSSKKDTGFYTKTISTSVGVPFSDRKCPKAALNGIIFKSGRFVYFAYPNLYSGDDTALTLTNISRPIQSVLDSLSPDVECFAEVVDDMYLLMVPDPEKYLTLCLRYSLTDKHWEIYEYPVRFLKFLKSNYAGAVMYGVFENDVDGDGDSDDTHGVFSISESGDAYDIFTVDNKEVPVLTQPIAFMLDTGQKTDSISNTKQFVESKLMFATLDDRDAFPFTTYVAIDGDPHVNRMDVSTDAPFWKPIEPDSSNPSVGVAGTAFTLGGTGTPASGSFNTLRQLVIRYSGKGKSIRHVIEGESQCNFKLYETYVRYKNLNGK